MQQDCALLDVTVLGAINLPERKGESETIAIPPYCSGQNFLAVSTDGSHKLSRPCALHSWL